jgi:heme/copper-type cytochrome/quinol oxidase subunit 3
MLSRVCIALTILLAFGFLGVKYVEWTEDFLHGLYPGTNMFFSLYFMMTGLHGLHVLWYLRAYRNFILSYRENSRNNTQPNGDNGITGILSIWCGFTFFRYSIS